MSGCIRFTNNSYQISDLEAHTAHIIIDGVAIPTRFMAYRAQKVQRLGNDYETTLNKYASAGEAARIRKIRIALSQRKDVSDMCFTYY